MDYKSYIAQKLNIDGISSEEVKSLIVTPPDTSLGDYALPCFRFAKVLRKSPAIIAEELASSFVIDDVVVKVVAVNGYLNFTRLLENDAVFANCCNIGCLRIVKIFKLSIQRRRRKRYQELLFKRKL